MPRVVAMPKMVPITAAISTLWPMGPLIFFPKIGYSAERMVSGKL